MILFFLNFEINNPRSCYIFYEKLYLPFNELYATNQKIKYIKWDAGLRSEERRREAAFGCSWP